VSTQPHQKPSPKNIWVRELRFIKPCTPVPFPADKRRWLLDSVFILSVKLKRNYKGEIVNN